MSIVKEMLAMYEEVNETSHGRLKDIDDFAQDQELDKKNKAHRDVEKEDQAHYDTHAHVAKWSKNSSNYAKTHKDASGEGSNLLFHAKQAQDAINNAANREGAHRSRKEDPPIHSQSSVQIKAPYLGHIRSGFIKHKNPDTGEVTRMPVAQYKKLRDKEIADDLVKAKNKRHLDPEALNKETYLAQRKPKTDTKDMVGFDPWIKSKKKKKKNGDKEPTKDADNIAAMTDDELEAHITKQRKN